MTHYCYGGGMSGCLYDYGPNFTPRLRDAIDALVWLYGGDGCFAEATLAEGEEKRMRRNLRVDGIHYFEKPAAAGAHYCEVSKCRGKCPEEQS